MTRPWIRAMRPWSFTASALSVLSVTGGLWWRGYAVDGLNALLSLAVIVLAHAGANVLSDCRDCEKGVDTVGSPNGVTWILDGTFSVRELRRFAAVLLAAGAGLGLLVAARSSWWVLLLGAAGLLLAAGYSFLKHRALGDLAVFLTFILLPGLGVGFVTTGVWLGESVLFALPTGSLTLAILNANNIRDVRTDTAAGCRTLPAVIGIRAATALLVLELALPYLLVAVLMATGHLPYAAVGVFLTLLVSAEAVSKLVSAPPSAPIRFADTLDQTVARLQLLFGALFVLAFPVGRFDFWTQLSLASLVTLGLWWKNHAHPKDLCGSAALREFILGICLAAVLWSLFWVGDKCAQALFGFAREQIASVYALRAGASPVRIGLLLLFLIGPAEELFWRGLVQRRLAARFGATPGFLLATVAYALVHVWSFNFMLVAAAATCGLFWGALYRLNPRHLPALAVSHAVWDVAVFLLFPI